MQQINVIVTPKAKQTISVTVNGVAMSVVNSDGSYSTTHYSGTPFIIPDTIIKNTAGATILTQPSATNTGVIADSVITNSDNTFSLNVPAETNPVLADITHIDSDLTPVVLPAMTPMVCTPTATPTYASAKLMKTGQTTSYVDYDDGYYESGRENDFFSLKSNNPFGNANRFTDELGGQTYANNVVIDWSTFDGVSVLGYYRVYALNSDFSTAITTAHNVSTGTFITGWRLANRKEIENVINSETALPLNYAPFNYNNSTPLVSSTTVKQLTGYSFRLDQYHQISSVSKVAGAANYLACRIFSVSGTTLT